MDKGTQIILLTSKLMLQVVDLPLEKETIDDLISKIADIRDVVVGVK